MSFKTISEVRVANKAAGLHFFERDTMRFFNSRIVSGLYAGRYFITRETFGNRLTHSVREAFPDGRVSLANTPSLEGRHSTLEDARDACRKLASEARK